MDEDESGDSEERPIKPSNYDDERPEIKRILGESSSLPSDNTIQSDVAKFLGYDENHRIDTQKSEEFKNLLDGAEPKRPKNFKDFLGDIKTGYKKQENAIYCDIIERYLDVDNAHKVGVNYTIPLNEGSKDTTASSENSFKEQIEHSIQKLGGDDSAKIIAVRWEITGVTVSEKAFREIKKQIEEQRKAMFYKNDGSKFLC
jgi:hypothetical protein